MDKQNKLFQFILSRGGFRHDISFNVAGYLLANYFKLGDDSDAYSRRLGFGGIITKEQLLDLSDGNGATFFLCYSNEGGRESFYLAAAKLDYDENEPTNASDVMLNPDDIVYYTDTWLYTGSDDPEVVKENLKSFYFDDVEAQQTTWDQIAPDVNRFKEFVQNPNLVVSDYFYDHDLSKMYNELGNGVGIFCTIGYDDTELKNPYRIILFQINSDFNIAWENKIILERTLP
ncbi:MAG: hypothetical protein ABI723_15560 [Bacteroidia bacterium]